MERHIYDEKDGLWYMKNRTIITRPVFGNGDVCDTLKSIIECFYVNLPTSCRLTTILLILRSRRKKCFFSRLRMAGMQGVIGQLKANDQMVVYNIRACPGEREIIYL